MSSAAYTTQIRLRNDLLALMNDESSADVTVIVGDDRVDFKSHRIMLIARSDYFRRLFSSASPDRNMEKVMLTHLDPDAFRIVRRFLYTAEEEDEATSPTTDDWRLVLEASRVTEFLGVHERSPAYHACFVSIFHRYAMERHDRETCREMWIAAAGYGLDNLLVGCAPFFWIMFGTGSNGSSGLATGTEDLRELLGGRLETLIKVINAVPAHLETPIGRFRLVRSWLLGQEQRIPDEDMYRRRAAKPPPDDGITTPLNTSPDVTDLALVSADTSPTQINGGYSNEGVADGYVRNGDEDLRSQRGLEGDDFTEELDGEEDEDEYYEEYDEEGTVSVPASPTSLPTPYTPEGYGLNRSDPHDRKRESYISTSTATTYASNNSRIPSYYGRPQLKHRQSLEQMGHQNNPGDGGPKSRDRSHSLSQPSQGRQQDAALRRRGTQASLRERETTFSDNGADDPTPTEKSGRIARPMSMIVTRLDSSRMTNGGGRRPLTPKRKLQRPASTVFSASTGGRHRGPPRSKVLASLDLTGILASDLVEEVEPSGLLSDRHLLTLYRAAAVQKEAGLSPTLWMPLPCGLNGKRYLTPNSKAGFGAVTISTGQRPEALQTLEAVLGSALQNPTAASATLSSLSVTYCASEPLKAGGCYTWTVVPTARERLVGIGVSSDATMGSGASSDGPAASSAFSSAGGGGRGGGGGAGSLASRLSFIGAALGSMSEALKSSFSGERVAGGRETPDLGGYISPPPFHDRGSAGRLPSHRMSLGGAWMDSAPPSPTDGGNEALPSSPTGSTVPPFPLRPPSSMDSVRGYDSQDSPLTPTQTNTSFHYPHNGPTSGYPTIPPFPHLNEASGGGFPPLPTGTGYASMDSLHPPAPHSTPHHPRPPSIAKFVGEDGGWSLWSDGSLRVGKIFVGRLPKGVTFSRGTPVTVKVDMNARTVGFEVGGVDCGVAFRNVPSLVYPSVVMGDGAGVSSSPRSPQEIMSHQSASISGNNDDGRDQHSNAAPPSMPTAYPPPPPGPTPLAAFAPTQYYNQPLHGNYYNQPQQTYTYQTPQHFAAVPATTTFTPSASYATITDPPRVAGGTGLVRGTTTVRREKPAAVVQKEVMLQDNGNFVIDVPVSVKNLLEGMPYQQGEEFTHLRYTAVTCKPEQFPNNYILRAKEAGRRIRIAVVVTMYNEDDVLFSKSFTAIMKNIAYLCTGRCGGWDSDGWKEIVVCIVSDGRSKCNPLTLNVLGLMGCYMDGLAKASVNGNPVTAHVFEYTNQLTVRRNLSVRRPQEEGKDGLRLVPCQTIFLLKEKNAKKINSHRWFFSAVCEQLKPEVCILIDVGTKPTKESFFHLYRAFERNPNVAGACGEIAAELGPYMNKLINPIVAVQNFEYKMSNILDKPLESVFGYISVLPGAFSAYRYEALQGEPLACYFKGEEPHGKNVKEANMYLAEDRILCFELVVKSNSQNVLKYVKSARAETDVPSSLHDLIKQRRRWLNGSFFASVHATMNFMRIFQSGHTFSRKWILMLEFIYNGVNLLFSWFNLGNFFLSFYFLFNVASDQSEAFCQLGAVESSSDPFYPNGERVFDAVRTLYIFSVVTMFIASLGNRPEGSKVLYLAMSIVFALLMAMMLFMGAWTVKVSVDAYKGTLNGKSSTGSTFFSYVAATPAFRDIVISLFSTYGLYLVSSCLFLDPWHVFTCMLQYLFMLPSFINILMVYAFCNLHDVSWGTKGIDATASDLQAVSIKITKNGSQVATVEIPSGDTNADQEWEALNKEMMKQRAELNNRSDKESKNPQTEQEDFFKQFRTNTLMLWLVTNGLLVYIFTTPQIVRQMFPNSSKKQSVNPYLTFLFWSVAVLSFIRFLCSLIYLIGWWMDGLEDAGKRNPFKSAAHTVQKAYVTDNPA
ncbi:Chitin synthase, class 2 [Dinochytrium kinnereticum]|nr:Chitin synthase, class 2 [Dinochytrium kinnereticum]